MKVSSGLKSFVFAASILAAATAGVRATTLTYFGSITESDYDVAEIGKAWQLIVVLPNPLTDFAGNPGEGNHLYLPVSGGLTIGGVDRAAGLGLVWQVRGGHDYQGYSGTSIVGYTWEMGLTSFGMVGATLSSPGSVTSADGLLLAGLPMSGFSTKDFSFGVMGLAGPYQVAGNVTGYTITNDVPLPDSAATALLLGLGLAVLPLLRRRGALVPGRG